MSDVIIYQTIEDGEVSLVDGAIELSGGLSSAAYLALFGGNIQDAGRKDDSAQWWGNEIEDDPDFTYRSATQHALRSLPVTSANIRKLEIAAEGDLAFFVNKKIATAVSVVVDIPAANRAHIVCTITAQSEEQIFEYLTNWGNQP